MKSDQDLSLWDVLAKKDGVLAAIFAQIEQRDSEALAELSLGLRMLSLLLTLSGSAMALFFLSPKETLGQDPSLLSDPLLQFHRAYVAHFPIVSITLLVGNLVLLGGICYIQIHTGWPRRLVQRYGLGMQPMKPFEEWHSIFHGELARALRTTERIEKIIFLGAAMIVLVIPVQLAVVAAIVTTFRKTMI